MKTQEALVKPKEYINDFRGLEVLRFLLSFAVIVWHYQHFFYPFIPYSSKELFLEKQPFFYALKLFYTQGLYAVHIFWFISGVIFYRIYEDRISSSKVSFKSYLINRFSRLYPLHLLTLILVLILQMYYFKVNNTFFIYQENTVKTFFQNLLFVQTWGINKFSFNGPTWSVSIEILIYLMFFILAKSKCLNNFSSLIFTLVFFTLLEKWELVFITTDILNCFYFFFAGCLFIKCYEVIKNDSKKIMTLFSVLCLAFLFVVKTPVVFKSIYERLSGRLDVDILLVTLIVIIGFLQIFKIRSFNRIPSKYFQILGDMTYSTYLIHFPIQLIIYIMLKPSDYKLFFSEKFFIIYIVSVMVLGRIVFKYFELPIQSFIRNKLLNSIK
jgi:peptidoglycan/LPS O-acetylase OafA/YrhL